VKGVRGGVNAVRKRGVVAVKKRGNEGQCSQPSRDGLPRPLDQTGRRKMSRPPSAKSKDGRYCRGLRARQPETIMCEGA